MPFFARPNLTDEQFKQLNGLDNILTLSGQTRIATVSGLTLIGDSGYIPIVATGATDYDVLTYVGGKISLLPMSGGSGGGYYSGATPTTCTVGGLVAGSPIGGQSISNILQSILVPTICPTLTAPSSTFSITPTISIAEVGSPINISGCAILNRGCINPQFTSGSDKRSGVAACYEYNVFGSICCVPSLGLSCNNLAFDPYYAAAGNNTVSSRAWYCCGVQPKDSSGSNYSTALVSGCTPTNTISISGIYPYYYGRVTCAAAAGVGRPSATCIKSMITGGTGFCTKQVCVSTSTICVNFGSTSSDYIWFAIPAASTPKTKWCVDALNNGNIGGVVSAGGNLFPAQDVVTNVCSFFWNSQSYQVYVSNYQTAASTIMYLKNS